MEDKSHKNVRAGTSTYRISYTIVDKCANTQSSNVSQQNFASIHLILHAPNLHQSSH